MVVGDADGRRAADDVGDREGDGRARGDRPRATGGDDEVGRRFGRLIGRRLHQDRQRGTSGSEAESGALAGGVRPRREAELAEPIAQPMPVDRDRRPGEDAVDRRVVGVGRNEPGLGDERGGDPTRRAADAGRRRGPKPAVEADIDDLDPPIDGVGQPGGRPGDRPPSVVAWRAEIVEQLAKRGSGRVAGCRRRAPA